MNLDMNIPFMLTGTLQILLNMLVSYITSISEQTHYVRACICLPYPNGTEKKNKEKSLDEGLNDMRLIFRYATISRLSVSTILMG